MAYDKNRRVSGPGQSKLNEMVFDTGAEALNTGVNAATGLVRRISGYDTIGQPIIKGIQKDAASQQRTLSEIRNPGQAGRERAKTLQTLDTFKSTLPERQEQTLRTNRVQNALNQASQIDPETTKIINYNESQTPGGSLRITSGPRKGMVLTAGASGGKINAFDDSGRAVSLKDFDAARPMESQRMLRNPDNFSSDKSYRIQDSGLEVQFDPSTSQEERQAFMRKPTMPGTRMRSNLPGKYDDEVVEDPRKQKLWEIATTSNFPRRRQAAIDSLKMLESSDQANVLLGENRRQFDITAEMTNEQNRLTNQQNQITNQQKERGLNINQQKADTDERYKNYLLTKQDNKNTLSKDQWIDNDQRYSADYQKRYSNDANFMTNQSNYLDADKTRQIDHKTLLYRENPQAAVEMYGQPNNQTKALLGLNMNPTAWANYIAATPAQQEQIINNIIQRKGWN